MLLRLIMYRLLIALAVAAAACPTVAAPPAVNSSPAMKAPPAVAHVVGRVVYVVDGDTLDVEIQAALRVPREGGGFLEGEGPFIVRVRLLADVAGRGCWTRETHLQTSIEDLAERRAEQQRGLAAEAHLVKLALGKRCVVVLPLTSRRLIDYMTLERILAVCKVGGKSLGETQIKAKHASTTKGGRLGE